MPITTQVVVIVSWLVFFKLLSGILDSLVNKDVISIFAARKTFHLLVGLWVVPLVYFVDKLFLAAIPLFLIFSANAHANLKRLRLAWRPALAKLYPFIAVVIPAALLLYFWNERKDVVVLSVLMMTVSDTAAAVGGRRFGNHCLQRTGKTLEGALFFFFSALALLLFVGWLGYGFELRQMAAAAFLTALFCALLEVYVVGALDNPLIVVFAVLLLRMFLP